MDERQKQIAVCEAEARIKQRIKEQVIHDFKMKNDKEYKKQYKIIEAQTEAETQAEQRDRNDCEDSDLPFGGAFSSWENYYNYRGIKCDD